MSRHANVGRVKLVKDRECKHSVIYKPDGDGKSPVTGVYVLKASLPEPFPKYLWLTLEV